MKNILIVGATRNLGAHLARFYSKQPNTAVYATARYAQPEFHGPNIHWISNVDITEERAGAKIAAQYSGDSHIDIVIFVATSSSALYEPENIHHVNFKRELRMYETTAMGPVFVTHHLVISKLIKKGTKIIMVGNKAGSIALQGKGRLGGDYGYHGANAALNMVGRILSRDLEPEGIAVAIVHPGRVKLEGESLGHKLPATSETPISLNEATDKLVKFITEFDVSKTGAFWTIAPTEDDSTTHDFVDPKEKLSVASQLPW